MGLLSSSRSSSTNYTDSSQNQQEASDSGVNIGEAGFISVQQLSDDVVEDAFAFGAGASNAAFDFANTQSDNAFLFSAGSQELATELASEALELGFTANEDALTFGAGVVGNTTNLIDDVNERAFQSYNNALDSSLSFAAGSIQEQSDNNASFLNLVNESGENFLNLIGDANQDFIGANSDFLDTSAALSRSTSENALEFGAGALQTVTSVTDKVLDNVANATSNTLSSLAAAQDRTVSAIGQQTRTDAAQSFDNLVKFASVSLAVVAGLFLLAKNKG